MATLDTALDATRRFARRLFSGGDDQKAREVAAWLKAAAPFRHLSAPTLQALAASMHPRTYQRDEVLYYEGDPGLGFYMVRHGRLRLVVEDEGGGVHELRQAGPHDIVGELSLFGTFRRMETAQADSETHVLGFFRPDLRALMKRSPQAGSAVMDAMARYLAARQAAVLDLVAERDGKVAALRMFEQAV